MQENINFKNLYSNIREMLFNMVPEKWESIYLYASVIDSGMNNETGEMYFYYYPKSLIKKNPVNVYEIPSKFNIDENEYMKLASQLYSYIKILRREYIKLDNFYWSNLSISLENVEFLVEFNDDDLINSPFTNEDRRIIWNYKYLNYPIERLNKKQKRVIDRYFKEVYIGKHSVKIYSETFYQKHIHNDITYNINSNENKRTENINKNNNIEQSETKKSAKNQLLKLTK